MRLDLAFGIAAVTVSIGIAGADEFNPPPMKDGLWETHVSQTQQGKKLFQSSARMCQAKEMAKSMKADGAKRRNQNECTSVVTHPSADSYVEESRCAKGPNAGSVTKVVYTFQGDTASHTETHMNEGKSESVMITDMKYLGSCPADMKPGDVVTSDGKKY